MVTKNLLATAVLLAAAGLLSTAVEAKKKVKGKSPVASLAAPLAATGAAYAGRDDAMQAADEIAAQHALQPAWVRSMIGQARFSATAAKLVLPPAAGVAKNWAAYRSRFVEPVRIGAGVKFWRSHRKALARAEQDSGVPAAIIVGVIGVETLYGQHIGNFRVIDALATLAFDFPTEHPRAAERSAFFRAELGHLLALSQRTKADPMRLRGSYAGAMGLPQFMPSSWARYALDFDQDGRIDLFGSPVDAIGSVANYFKAFNWEPGLPTHYPVRFDTERLDLEALLLPDILPTFSVASFQAKGAVLEGVALTHRGPLALVELQNGSDPASYVAGSNNFYTVTRYNWSSYYAMAVIELGQAVQAALADQEQAAKPLPSPQR